ncbi:MAG: cytochrome c peroxidase [Gemmataceae bacterium]
MVSDCKGCVLSPLWKKWLVVLFLPLPLLTILEQYRSFSVSSSAIESTTAEVQKTESDRSPVDLWLTNDERWLLTVNQTSATVSLVDIASGKVVAEVPCGEKPSALAVTSDNKRVLVTGTYGGDLTAYDFSKGRLKRTGSIFLGFEPRGAVISPNGKLAYVALETANRVAVVDLESLKEIERIEAGRWPRYLALTSDGKRLAVGSNGDGGVTVIDTEKRKKLFSETFVGLNLGQMHISKDDQFVYFPWMIYRLNPITPTNIRIGWVLASRIARVRLDRQTRREALELDKRGEAVADPHGLAFSADEKWLVSAASGSQELLVFKTKGIPWLARGARDHIPPELLRDRDRFYRISLGGRPMAIRFGPKTGQVYVANYLLNAVQIVDLKQRKIIRTIPLGGPKEPSLARKGEAIFYDGRRSLDQWYSCHTCHHEGHTNNIAMDTFNDGRFRNYKTVLSLRNVTQTGPWTWHGWQKDLNAAMRKSLQDTMLTQRKTTDEDVKALIAFLKTLRPPPNPYRKRDGSLTPKAERGKKVFHSAKAGCRRCHRGPFFTDGRIHDVGTGSPTDVYRGYNTPSLIGAYSRMLYLHDGRAESLEDVLQKHHKPERVTGMGALTKDELNDLIAYVKSL